MTGRRTRAAAVTGCTGLVLAGGRARRMDGRDKATAVLGGRTLLARVLDRFGPQCLEVALATGARTEATRGFEGATLPDPLPNFAGPLAGVLAGLDWTIAAHPEASHLASVPVDLPFLPSDLVERLARAIEDTGKPAACAASGDHRHWTVALWPIAGRETVRRAVLDAGERRVSAVLDGLGCAEAVWASEPYDPFLNVNAVADLAAAEARLAADPIG